MIPPLERAVDAVRDLAAYALASLADKAMAPARCDHHDYDERDDQDAPEVDTYRMSGEGLHALLVDAAIHARNGATEHEAAGQVLVDIELCSIESMVGEES